MSDYDGLPGSDLVDRGIADLAAGKHTVEALLVTIARTRLRRVGLSIPSRDIPDAEIELYRALGREEPETAYGRYNSLLRRLVSFSRALERERGAELRRTGTRGGDRAR
jgi:hypothetical protein